MKIELCDTFFYRIPSEKADIYSQFNTNKENVFRNNKAIDFYAGELVKITQNDYISHIVKPTETLLHIANQHKISVEKLRRDNDIKNDKLFIGQVIKIYKLGH